MKTSLEPVACCICDRSSCGFVEPPPCHWPGTIRAGGFGRIRRLESERPCQHLERAGDIKGCGQGSCSLSGLSP
jgi:hypothetical protein